MSDLHFWETVQEDQHTLVERMPVPGGWVYSIRRLRTDFEQLVFVPQEG